MAESETADLWQPKWTESQTVLAAAIHTLDGGRSYPGQECRSPGRHSGWELELGIVEQSQGERCCWLQRDRERM